MAHKRIDDFDPDKIKIEKDLAIEFIKALLPKKADKETLPSGIFNKLMAKKLPEEKFIRFLKK